MNGISDNTLLTRTELSRGFGFLRFSSYETSRQFLEQNYPMLRIPYQDAADDGEKTAMVRIAYSRERDERKKAEMAEGDWTCRNVSSLSL